MTWLDEVKGEEVGDIIDMFSTFRYGPTVISVRLRRVMRPLP